MLKYVKVFKLTCDFPIQLGYISLQKLFGSKEMELNLLLLYWTQVSTPKSTDKYITIIYTELLNTIHQSFKDM